MRSRRAFVIAPTIAMALGLAHPAGVAARVIRDPRDTRGALDLTRVSLRQRGFGLVWKTRVHGTIAPRELTPLPVRSDHTPHYLCLGIRPARSSVVKRLCLGKGTHGPAVGIEAFHGGRETTRREVHAHLLSGSGHRLAVRFSSRAARIGRGRYHLYALSGWSGPACSAGSRDRSKRATVDCVDRAPGNGNVRYRVRAVRAVGCRDEGIGAVREGPAKGRRVALTFDDGPSDYTQKVVSILSRYGVHGTFFEIGEQVSAYADEVRRVLAAGNELGDHTMHHTPYPGKGEITDAAKRIQEASGFRPCLFRPPEGKYDSSTVAEARSAGMSTVLWSVDPQDWSLPGSQAIYSRVVSAVRPGSIVIMHDGGGNRSETVAALPRIIRTLKSRGYRLVTVSKLLGQRMIYRAVG